MAVKSCGEYEQHPYYLKCVHHHSFISEKPLGFFLWIAPNPTFCVPSQFVSWSAHPLEPPSETYVSALHDMWSTKVRKLSMALSVNWTSFVAKSLVQLVTHSCLKSVKPFHDIPDKKLFLNLISNKWFTTAKINKNIETSSLFLHFFVQTDSNDYFSYNEPQFLVKSREGYR